MGNRHILIGTVSFVALSLGVSVSAQTASPAAPGGTATAGPADELADAIVVTGIRESFASAASLKRRAPQVVDAIVAEDIGKLPDLNTAETAARIPGLQVYRRGGEAEAVLVRGLPFFTTTYNGREIFTAETRVVALQDFPSSNIAALEVYKTSTADLVEPGLAGIVNVRSRKPFDFKEAEFSGSAWGLYTRQGDTIKPNVNLLATKRWDTGIGEIGILVEGSYQSMRYLDAEVSNTDFVANPTVNGQQIRLPDIQRLFYRSGERERPSADVALQWKPTPDLELYAEGLYQGFINKIDDRLLEEPLYGGASYSNIVLRPGTNLVRSGTVVNPGGNLFSFQGATFNRTDTFQVAAGAKFTRGPFKLNIDIARSLSTFRGSTESLDRVFNGARTVNFNNDVPTFTITGPNFTDPGGQTFQGLFEENQRAAGRDYQFRADGQYDFDNSVLKNIQFGVRYADRYAQRNYANRYAFLLPKGINQTALPLQFSVFNGVDFQPTYNFVAPTYQSIRDNLAKLRQFVIDNGGTNYTVADVVAPLIFRANEKTIAGYGQVNFGFGENIAGIVGLRVESAKLSLPSVPVAGGTPVSVNRETTEYLPNASLLLKLPEKPIQLRLAFSKTVTRPNFSDLGGITFGAPPSGGVGTQSSPFGGGGGNPFLLPFTSMNYDASLEYYFSRAGFAAVTYFHRDLDKFIQQATARFTDPALGVVEVTGPVNTGKGRIDGVEAQGQAFLDLPSLPDWAHAFGIQANVTYLDAKVQSDNGAGGLAYFPITDQVNGVSKWNYNVSGIYDDKRLSVRLSYNGRSSFAATRQYRGNDVYTETAHPAGRLDLSTQYKVRDFATVFADWTNITRDPFSQSLNSARDGATPADFVRYLRYDESTVSLGVRFTLK